MEADVGIANNQKLPQHNIDRDESKLPSYTNLQTLQKPATESKLEPFKQGVVSPMQVDSSHFHLFNVAADAGEKQYHENYMSVNPTVTVKTVRSSHNYQPPPLSQTGVKSSRKPGSLGTLDVQRVSISREASHSPNPSPIILSTRQSIQPSPKMEPVTQTKAEEVSQELASDVVKLLHCGSMEEVEQAIKARVLSLLNADGSRKRKAENAGIVETPDPKRRVSCDQCSKTMVRRCDLR